MLRSLFAFGLVWLLGCSQGPPPIVVAPIIEPIASDWKAPEKPKESDAAAKALLAEVLAAHTGGKPERLAKLTSLTFERTGTARNPNGAYDPVIWKGKIEGKKKYQVLFTYLYPQGSTIISVYNEGKGYRGLLGKPTITLNASALQDVALQIGEESGLYLFGLNDPALIAQTATLPKAGEKEILGLHVWSPTIRHLFLHLDAKTKRIVTIQYMGAEDGTPTLKEISITGHREIDGLLLPEKYTLTASGLLLSGWEKLAFEAGAAIDPKSFEVP